MSYWYTATVGQSLTAIYLLSFVWDVLSLEWHTHTHTHRWYVTWSMTHSLAPSCRRIEQCDSCCRRIEQCDSCTTTVTPTRHESHQRDMSHTNETWVTLPYGPRTWTFTVVRLLSGWCDSCDANVTPVTQKGHYCMGLRREASRNEPACRRPTQK